MLPRTVASQLECSVVLFLFCSCLNSFTIGLFAPWIAKHGPSKYKELMWECGLIGQLLYLEAEALGYRGGCLLSLCLQLKLFLLQQLDLDVTQMMNFTNS